MERVQEPARSSVPLIGPVTTPETAPMADQAKEPAAAAESRRGPPFPAAIRLRDLALVVVLTAAVLLAIRLLIPAGLRTPDNLLLLLAIQSAVPLAAVHLVIVRGRGIAWPDLGLRPAPRGWYLRALLLTLPVLPLIGIVNALTQALAGGQIRNPQIEILAPMATSWTGLAGLLLMAGMVAPFVEEVVFRGLLYGWLRQRLGIAAGAALSALAFAAAHGILILVPALFLHGLILAVVYERSASLWPPIILHGAFNAVMAIALFAALAAGVTP